MKPSLGRLKKLELRKAWLSEPEDFTPWLALQDNLQLLGESIGIELELEAQEKAVGPFRADLLCRDTSTNDWVVIENQLDRSNHDHLGKLLTYAAGLDALTVVWIAERFTSEHRAVMDWLNEHTDAKLNLFALEIELWQIGDSPPAPKFNVVSQPNEWARTVQQVARSGEVSEHKQAQLKFWTAFRQYMESKGSTIKCRKPAPQHWMSHSLGRSGTELSSVVSYWNSLTNSAIPEIRAEVVLTGDRSKQEFEALEQRKESIETSLGFPLTWHNPEGKVMCRIYTRQDADFLDESKWNQQFEWLRQRLEILQKVFGPLVKKLQTANSV